MTCLHIGLAAIIYVPKQPAGGPPTTPCPVLMDHGNPAPTSPIFLCSCASGRGALAPEHRPALLTIMNWLEELPNWIHVQIHTPTNGYLLLDLVCARPVNHVCYARGEHFCVSRACFPLCQGQVPSSSSAQCHGHVILPTMQVPHLISAGRSAGTLGASI